MPRTVVYDTLPVQAAYADLAPAAKLGKVPGRKGRQVRKQAEKETKQAGGAGAGGGDDYVSKIAKYVPAEVITLVSLGFAAFKPTGTSVWWWVAAGVVANILYLFGTALSQPSTTPRPRLFFYVLSGIAFVLWAMATINAVQVKVGISGADAAGKQTFILAMAAFIIPLLDTILAKIDFNLAT